MYTGPSPFELRPWEDVTNPVLTAENVTDVPAGFVADPFMVAVEGVWHMFFEVTNRLSGNGEIALATSPDGKRWRYERVVLREPFHLSYPYVFAWDNGYYMAPEMCAHGESWLYRATNFPSAWERAYPVLPGALGIDPSLLYFGERWWLYSAENIPGWGILRLHSSDRLEGPWHEHPQSPVVVDDPSSARPAGRVTVVDDRIVRFSQDCSGDYGLHVKAFMVDALSGDTYRESAFSPDPVLRGSGMGWNANGMHHLDPHRLDDGSWVACVDGWRWSR
jgi:hypothetical protein